MLNALRSSAGSIVVKALLILLALSFMAWGVTDYLGGGPGGNAVATVGDTQVEPTRFARALDRDVQRMRSIFGPTFSREQAQALGLGQRTLGRLVGDALVAEEADELGVAVDDEIVRRNVSRDEAFHGMLGSFDRDRFRQIAANLGYSEQGLLEQIRADMARDQVLSAVSGGVSPPTALLDAVARHRLQTRTVAYLTLPEVQGLVDAPTEAGLAKFRADNEARFTIPERRRVTYVSLEIDDLAPTIEITQDDLTQAFEERRSSFEQAEERGVRQMILPGEDAAKAAKARLDAGEAFEAVAADAAGMDAQATDLGVVGRGALLPELAGPVFELAEGAATDPVETAFGWHIAQVTEVRSGAAPALDDVKDELTAELQRERAADELYAVSTRLEDAIAGGATLEEAAREVNLPVATVEALARDGSDGHGTAVEGLPGDGRAFVEEAFQSEPGIPSVLTESGGDGYFVLRVESVLEPRFPPLDEIRAQVEAAWLEVQRAEAARAQAHALRDRIADGAALTAIAAEVGAEVKFSPPVRRDGQPDLETVTESELGALPGSALIQAAFQVPEGGAVVAETAGGYQIGRVESVSVPDAGAASAARESLARELGQSLRDDVLNAFSQGLQEKHPVSVNQRVLDAILNPDAGGAGS